MNFTSIKKKSIGTVPKPDPEPMPVSFNYYRCNIRIYLMGFLGSSAVKNPPAMQEIPFDLWVVKILWRRVWQPTPVSFPGESHRQRSLVTYSLQGRKESHRTAAVEHTGAHAFAIATR